MSAEEFSLLLDVASPEELNALAFAGGRNEATAVGRTRFSMAAEYRQLCRERASPGAAGWGAPMHYLLLAISWLANKSRWVTAGCAVAVLLTVSFGYVQVLRWVVCQDYGISGF
ncbi:MAG: hypothetical protein K2W95_30265 [Candidatus Obscuribacterales bacterium]|nr:hypothetical protein [Candidatus Obscuribacterales bacterium]